MVTQAAPPVGFTQDDLRKIDAAIVRGVGSPVKVRLSDGREVTNRTMEELLSARRMVADSITAARPRNGFLGRSVRAVFTRD